VYSTVDTKEKTTLHAD